MDDPLFKAAVGGIKACLECDDPRVVLAAETMMMWLVGLNVSNIAIGRILSCGELMRAHIQANAEASGSFPLIRPVG